MKIHPEELPALLRLAGGGSARRAPACPDEEVLAGLVEGGVSEERRREVEAHLADCRDCLAQLGLLTRLARAEADLPPVPARWLDAARGPRRSGARSWRWAVPAAAGLLVALGLVLRPEPPGGPRPAPEVRAEPAAVANPAAAILHPAEGAVLGRRQIAIRWTPVPGALSYEVRLTDADGGSLWEEETADTESVPPATLALAEGGPYFAWVEARLADGRTLASRAVAFRVGVGGGKEEPGGL